MSLSELKDKIKSAPISEIIENYLDLQTRGHNKLAVCPFHNDTKPSLNVNDSKGLFKCFACGAAGDGIGFVEKYKNLDFIEALKECCQILGLNFDDYQNQKVKNPKELAAKKLLHNTNLLFQKMAESPGYKKIFESFLSNRGLDLETAKVFQLGFAANGNKLLSYLQTISDAKSRDQALKLALELGLIRKGDKNQYDTFRDRVIFPIWDHSGHTRGFGGRSTQSKTQPKYLNSFDSFYFKKSQILYGFHLAKQDIRNQDYVILVEGYMDMVSLYHHGFKNTVAIMGVALSNYSIQKLKTLTKNFILGLDSDDAGQKAMARINKDLMNLGVVPKVIDFSPFKDPDEFIVKEGKIELLERIDQAPYFIDLQIKALIPDKIPEVSSQKIALLNRSFELLAPLGNELEATERIMQVASNLNLRSDTTSLLKAYSDFLDAQKKVPKKAPKFEPRPSSQRPSQVPYDSSFKAQANALGQDEQRANNLPKSQDETQDKTQQREEIPKLDQILLDQIIRHPRLLESSESTILLDYAQSHEVKIFLLRFKEFIYEIDYSQYENFVTHLTASEDFSSQLRELASSSLFKYEELSWEAKVKEKVYKEVLKKLKEYDLKAQKKKLLAKLEFEKSESIYNELMNQVFKLDKEIKTLD